MLKVLQMCSDLGIVELPETGVERLEKSVKTDLLRLFIKKDITGFSRKLKEAPDVIKYELALSSPVREVTVGANERYIKAKNQVESKFMATGCILSQYILDVICVHNLTPKQKGQLINIKQGSWNPEGIDLSEALQSILVMDIKRASVELIYLLKEFTPMPDSSEIVLMVDGHRASFKEFREDWAKERGITCTKV